MGSEDAPARSLVMNEWRVSTLNAPSEIVKLWFTPCPISPYTTLVPHVDYHRDDNDALDHYPVADVMPVPRDYILDNSSSLRYALWE